VKKAVMKVVKKVEMKVVSLVDRMAVH